MFLKLHYLIFIFLIGFLSCKEKSINKDKQLEVISLNYEGLEPYLNKKDDTVYVINFWATWCKPCIEELPYFEKLLENYKDKKVKVLLISLDMPTQLDKRLIPYVKEHQLKAQVILLNDPDQNNWIPKIDPHWDGAIPATLIYNKEYRRFYAKSFNYSELEKTVKQFML